MKTAEENRIDNARHLAQIAGGTTAFANKIDRSVTQASRFMGSNPTVAIGPAMARHIEACFGKPDGWLDANHGNGVYNKDGFAERLNHACDQAGIPVRGRTGYIQERLSRKVSLTAVRKWLIGEAVPDKYRIAEIAEIVNSTVEQLLNQPVQHSKQEDMANYSANVQAVKSAMVPLVSWVQAGAFCNSETQVLPYDCEMILCPNEHASNRTFALRVVGDSMTAPYGRTYPEGTVIFVDPEKVAEPHMRVIAKTDQGYTFKQLEENELGQRYLKPLNPHHQPIFDGGIEICGVVIGSYMPE
ncbi:LexA family protein [Vibrio metschnikovii]|uniref:LexA family protein n=1 Tax=Vibrio metschnikovii TaxID=28172 RepID=UPI001C30D387|nr:S24 family peptidase [Vibrio metschnikovii]